MRQLLQPIREMDMMVHYKLVQQVDKKDKISSQSTESYLLYAGLTEDLSASCSGSGNFRLQI
jgi:hypothetical protein